MIPISTPRGALSQGEMVSMGPPHGVARPTERYERRSEGPTQGTNKEELPQAQVIGGARTPGRGEDTGVDDHATPENQTAGMGTKETPGGCGSNILEAESLSEGAERRKLAKLVGIKREGSPLKKN